MVTIVVIFVWKICPEIYSVILKSDWSYHYMYIFTVTKQKKKEGKHKTREEDTGSPVSITPGKYFCLSLHNQQLICKFR